MKRALLNTLAIIFLILPIIAISFMYSEGGFFGVFMYISYSLTAFMLFKLPLIAIKILKGESI